MRPTYLVNIRLCYCISKIVRETHFCREISSERGIQVEEQQGSTDGSVQDLWNKIQSKKEYSLVKNMTGSGEKKKKSSI